jgi:hypothetical protein
MLYTMLYGIDRVTLKEALGNSPFFLVYGKEAILSTNLYLPSLQLSQSSRGHPSSSMQQRIDTLLMVEEERERVRRKFAAHQQKLRNGLINTRLAIKTLK